MCGNDLCSNHDVSFDILEFQIWKMLPLMQKSKRVITKICQKTCDITKKKKRNQQDKINKAIGFMVA